MLAVPPDPGAFRCLGRRAGLLRPSLLDRVLHGSRAARYPGAGPRRPVRALRVLARTAARSHAAARPGARDRLRTRRVRAADAGAGVRRGRDGAELAGWWSSRRQMFGVPVLRGRLEALGLAARLQVHRGVRRAGACERTRWSMVRRCGDLLAPDGVLLLQTPWYRGEGPDWSMFQADEHIHLFTEESIRLLLERAGFEEVRVQPSLFPYDMWVVATRGRFRRDTPAEGDWRMPAAFRALLDLALAARDMRRDSAAGRRSTAGAPGQVEELTGLLRESEADRAARLAQVDELTRAPARVGGGPGGAAGQVEELTRALRASRRRTGRRGWRRWRSWTGSCGSRRRTGRRGSRRWRSWARLLRESEADRAARLAQDGGTGHLRGELTGSCASRRRSVKPAVMSSGSWRRG